MAKAPTDDQVVQALVPLMASAKHHQEQLSALRIKQDEIYNADPYGNERAGWATTVAPTAQDAVEWIKPYLFNIFTGDFFALSAKNQEGATQLERYIKFKLFRQQDGADEIDDFLHYSLVNHYGAIKVTHRDDFEYESKTVPEMDAQTFQQVEASEDLTISLYDEVSTPDPINGGDIVSYEKVKVMKKKVKFSGPKIECVPPKELYYTPGYSKLELCPLVAHVVKRSLDYVHRMERDGIYKKGSYEAVKNKIVSKRDNSETQAETFTQEDRDGLGSPDTVSYIDDAVLANSEVEIWECYCRMDIDGDGFLENAIVHLCEEIALHDPEENIYGSPPFELGSALRQPHNMLGRSFADMMEGWQRAMTNMQRAIQDAALISTKRGFITDSVNTQAALRAWSPGDVAKVDSVGGVQDIDFGAPNQYLFKAYEQISADKDKNSGVNEAAMGLDRDSNNKTARGMGMKLSVTQARQKLYADRLSRTFDRMIRRVIDILRLFPPSEGSDSAGGEIQIDKVDFTSEYMVKIDVGVGPQDMEWKAQAMDQHLQFLLKAGMQVGIADPSHVIRTLDRKAAYLKLPMTGLYKSMEEMGNGQSGGGQVRPGQGVNGQATQPSGGMGGSNGGPPVRQGT